MVSKIFQSAYTKAKRPSEQASSPTTTKAFVDPDQSWNPDLPAIQQTNAALYFDDIEGFGEWSILLSNRARKDLRVAKHADAAMFRIVMNKIKCDHSLMVMTAAESSQAIVPGTVLS